MKMASKSANVCAKTDPSVSRRSAGALYVGMTTETVGAVSDMDGLGGDGCGPAVKPGGSTRGRCYHGLDSHGIYGRSDAEAIRTKSKTTGAVWREHRAPSVAPNPCVPGLRQERRL